MDSSCDTESAESNVLFTLLTFFSRGWFKSGHVTDGSSCSVAENESRDTCKDTLKVSLRGDGEIVHYEHDAVKMAASPHVNDKQLYRVMISAAHQNRSKHPVGFFHNYMMQNITDNNGCTSSECTVGRAAYFSRIRLEKRERVTVSELMSNTFAHRRHDVVSLQLSIREIKERWPALFDMSQVNAEFHRITTVNLEAKFMFKLDHYTPKLLAIFQAKKGAAAERHRAEMNILLQSGISIDKTREVVIRCLIDHLGEDVGALIKEFETSDDSAVNVEEELGAEMMALYLVRSENGQIRDVGIVIEGSIIFSECLNSEKNILKDSNSAHYTSEDISGSDGYDHRRIVTDDTQSHSVSVFDGDGLEIVRLNLSAGGCWELPSGRNAKGCLEAVKATAGQKSKRGVEGEEEEEVAEDLSVVRRVLCREKGMTEHCNKELLILSMEESEKCREETRVLKVSRWMSGSTVIKKNQYKKWMNEKTSVIHCRPVTNCLEDLLHGEIGDTSAYSKLFRHANTTVNKICSWICPFRISPAADKAVCGGTGFKGF
ncbi:hypothetical protein D9C73_007861 [Collichthys lucidus]|uniref:Uncharacterized protein n=1 Tax=Collichthys lucidus TaxID=240159 RepID=A0A4U5UI15_COLLU|nr:hypothetical protein D9C73_007861 [Collichthys lucidus]